MKKQQWFCENCNQKGFIEHSEHADLFTVVCKIDDAHQSVSPDCETPVSRLRVVNNEKDI